MANQNQNPQNLPAVIQTSLNNWKPVLAKYAKRSYQMGDFLRSANLAILNNKDLTAAVQTDQGRISLMNALMYAAVTGLSLNPAEGKACLIAYGNSINYQIMKNGLIELALETKQVEFIVSDVVRENDTARIKKTMAGDDIEHYIALTERGKIIGFYAAMKLINGGQHVVYMTIKEMEEHRDKYGKGISKPDSAWRKSFEGQGNKTVVKRLLTRIAIGDDNTLKNIAEYDEMESAPVPAEQSPPADIAGRFDEAAGQVETESSQERPENKKEPEPQKAEEQKPEEAAPEDGPPQGAETEATKTELDIF